MPELSLGAVRLLLQAGRMAGLLRSRPQTQEDHHGAPLGH